MSPFKFHNPFVILWERVSACSPIYAPLALSFTLLVDVLLAPPYSGLSTASVLVVGALYAWPFSASATLQCPNCSAPVLPCSLVTPTWFLHSNVPEYLNPKGFHLRSSTRQSELVPKRFCWSTNTSKAINLEPC